MIQHRLWLLLLPYVGLLWVAFYSFHDPTLFGFPSTGINSPGVPLSALLTWIGRLFCEVGGGCERRELVQAASDSGTGTSNPFNVTETKQ
jgi:hypothetical protein